MPAESLPTQRFAHAARPLRAVALRNRDALLTQTWVDAPLDVEPVALPGTFTGLIRRESVVGSDRLGQSESTDQLARRRYGSRAADDGGDRDQDAPHGLGRHAQFVRGTEIQQVGRG